MKAADEILRDAVDLDHGAADLQVTSAPGGMLGGATIYKGRKVSILAVPGRGTAYSRTIRIHEAIHAQKQKAPTLRQSQDLACQAIQDVLVHTRDWPTNLPDGANRDALCTAFQDLLQIKRLPQAELDADCGRYNTALLASVRALAIVYRLGSFAQRRRAECVASRLGSSIAGELLSIVQLANKRGRGARAAVKRATDRFRALLRRPDEEETVGVKGIPGHGHSGSLRPRFRIVELPLSADCSPNSARALPSRSGAHVRASRLPVALASGSLAGVFLRRCKEVGGAVLIDVSGSMNPSAEILSAICACAPGAQVAYYSGKCDRGELVVYARDGRRYDGAELPCVHGGNDVDLDALRWLLRQDGPRWIVTDRQFCGGPEGEAAAALSLLESAERTGAVRCIPSLYEALGAFRELEKLS